MDHCDLCGKESGRLNHVDDLWGLGVSTLCRDAAECASTWGEGFAKDPNETDVLSYSSVFLSDLDRVEPVRAATRRLARA